MPAVGSGQWLGSAITPTGRIAVTCRVPTNGVRLFDSNGVPAGGFDTPQVIGLTGEVVVFSDGTLAICDQSGDIELYTEAGVHQGTFAIPAPSRPWSGYVDSSDVLFVCDADFSRAGKIHKFDRNGNLLVSWPLNFAPADVQSAPDGTLWTRSSTNGIVFHLSASGALLSSFPTHGLIVSHGLALAADGTLYTANSQSTSVLHYPPDGAFLGSFPLAAGSQPTFITIRECGATATPYCTAKTNSLGCVPAIAHTGAPSASMSSGFVIRADNVLNNKSGLLFYGFSGPTALPFQGGTLCVQTPLRRTQGVSSGGTPPPVSDCSGVFALDMNAFAHSAGPPVPSPQLTVPGTLVNVQWWGRDPGFAAPDNTTLSDALEYTVCPS